MTRRVIAPAYLFACLLLGGASAAGFVGNFFLQIAAIPLIGLALWRIMQQGVPSQIRAPLALLGGLVAIHLLQLIPLPPFLWTHLAGRDPIVRGYELLGLPLPWLPLTLAPGNATASFLWLLPAFATFLAITVLGVFRARWIGIAIVAVTLASVTVGALQLIGGAGGPLYFYDITNDGVAVGFFANSNHNATLLLICIPFLAALQATLLKQSRSPRSGSAIHLLVAGGYALIVVGLIINTSLAGIGLGLPVALGTWIVFGNQRPAVRRGLIGAAAAISIIALGTIIVGPFGNNLIGQQGDNAELSRQTSFTLTARAAGQYFPVGSGVGSFQRVYNTQETLDTVGATYMNHAHNDWLEIALETGVVGIALAIALIVWGAIRSRAIWRAEERDYFAQAAVIAAVIMLLHSLVDYPLRTAALSAVFAACIGLMSGVRPYVRPTRALSAARHLTL